MNEATITDVVVQGRSSVPYQQSLSPQQQQQSVENKESFAPQIWQPNQGYNETNINNGMNANMQNFIPVSRAPVKPARPTRNLGSNASSYSSGGNTPVTMQQRQWNSPGTT